MKKILFFLLVSASAFAQPKVPYGTTGDISAESDMWLRYNFATRSYDIYFKDANDDSSLASDSVITVGTVRFKKLLPSSTLLTAISANMPLTYNSTTGILGINYDSLYITTDNRYFRLSGTNANITGKYLIGGVPIVDRSGAFSRVLTSDSIAAFQGGNSTDQRNLYRNSAHAFQDRLGGSTYALVNSTGLSIGGGNASINNDGRAYFGWRTSIGKAPTSNMLEVGGNVNFDGSHRINQRLDIDGLQFGGSINENVSIVTFGHWGDVINPATAYTLGVGGGAIGDWGANDPYIYVTGRKGVAIATGTDQLGTSHVILADTLKQVKITSGKTGIAQALTIQNDSTLAIAGRGSELKFTATGDTTLASIQVVTQTTNNKVGLMKFLTNNGTSNGVRLTIDQNGNVGIADETPSYTLDITGTLRNTTGAAFATSSGNVAIGTTTADQKLHVFGGGDTRIKLGNETSQWSWAVGQAGAGNLSLVEEGVAVRLLVEASTGRIGIGTTSPATSAILDVTSTTGAVLFPRMTSTQRDALTAANGMVIYNTTTDKLQVRAAGAWVELH